MRSEKEIRERLESIEWFLRVLPELMNTRNLDVTTAVLNTLRWVLGEEEVIDRDEVQKR